MDMISGTCVHCLSIKRHRPNFYPGCLFTRDLIGRTTRKDRYYIQVEIRLHLNYKWAAV